MPITYVQGQSGRVYPFNISGLSPNQTEQQKINEVLIGLGDASAASAEQEEEAGIISGFRRGLDRGIRQTGALLTDALPAVAADLVGADEYRDRQLAEYEETMEAINREAPSFVPTYKDIEDLGDASVYAAETIGQFVPSILTSIAGGGIGGFGGGGYGGDINGSNNSNANKSSGAEGWEDRSYGNSSENSEYENGRSRRKRGVSNERKASNETN